MGGTTVKNSTADEAMEGSERGDITNEERWADFFSRKGRGESSMRHRNREQKKKGREGEIIPTSAICRIKADEGEATGVSEMAR